MAKFIIMGKYTAKGLRGFVNNPETDRRAATTALCESVGAKLKDYAKGYNVSGDLADALNKKVEHLIKEACTRAEANGRKTVMAKDL